MKIGIDVAQTAAERTGCAWYADALARALVNVARPEGHQFVLYHQFGDWINGEPGHGTYLTGQDVEMPLRLELPVPARARWREIEAGRAPLPGEPDVVVASSFHAPRVGQAKLLYVVHDMVFWTHPDFATDATRVVCQRELGQAIVRAAGFVFVSEATRADFEQFFPDWLKSSGRPHVIAGGASRWPTVAKVADRSETAPWLMVGSVEPRKNHKCALVAYENYHTRSNLRRPLVIVGGRGWHSEATHHHISELKSKGLPVKYEGYVDDRDLLGLYHNAFALLQPSWHEGFGLPVLEAFSQGLPAIGSNRGSLPEVLGGAGLTCPPDKPDAWTDAMLGLEQDDALRRRLVEAGLRRAADFSWTKTAKTVLELAKSVTLT